MQQRAIGGLERNGDHIAIDGNALDRNATGILVIDPALEVHAHGLSVERGAVVEEHAIADGEGVGETIVRDRPLAGDPGMELAFEVFGDETIIDVLQGRLRVARRAFVLVEAERLIGHNA